MSETLIDGERHRCHRNYVSCHVSVRMPWPVLREKSPPHTQRWDGKLTDVVSALLGGKSPENYPCCCIPDNFAVYEGSLMSKPALVGRLSYPWMQLDRLYRKYAIPQALTMPICLTTYSLSRIERSMMFPRTLAASVFHTLQACALN